ncbi:MAG TPA: ROK family protein [Ktedonobacteraceae bacterium]|nr:ROK family protein [Ktedonobacteraceae bacterium]
MTTIAIDIGGSNTRIGLFPALDAADYMPVAKFPTQQDYHEELRRVAEALQSIDNAASSGVGVSVAARIAKNGRSVVAAPNLPGYVDQPFARDLSARLHVPARLAHDTVCGLLAEKTFGSLHDSERCAYLTVSTGTGAAIQLAKGAITLTSSIEIGHQILDGNQRECLCGQVGCLETYTGGRQITLREGRAPNEIADAAFWDIFCDKLAQGLVNLAMLTRIDAVAASGAIVLNRPQLLEQLQQKINQLDLWSPLALLSARLGEDAPLVGAALLTETPEDTILH